MPKSVWILLVGIGGGGGVLLPATLDTPQAGSPHIVVYKSPTCGCCTKWADHLQTAGFRVETIDVQDVMGLKIDLGIPVGLYSCHTAVVDGYAVEGHVPADVVRRMLRERPAIAGIAVPGMPLGSPGMEGPRQQRYNVVAFDTAGGVTVYARR